MHMIVHLFPEPTAQSKAIGVFSTSGALGNSAYCPLFREANIHHIPTSVWAHRRGHPDLVCLLAMGLLLHVYPRHYGVDCSLLSLSDNSASQIVRLRPSKAIQEARYIWCNAVYRHGALHFFCPR